VFAPSLFSRPASRRASCASAVSPKGGSSFDIALLAPLGAAGEQNHQNIAIASEIQPVAGPEIDLVLKYAFANRLHAREIALLHAGNCDRDLRACYWIEIRKPFGERAFTVVAEIVANFEH
jgi:hypothetical protein